MVLLPTPLLFKQTYRHVRCCCSDADCGDKTAWASDSDPVKRNCSVWYSLSCSSPLGGNRYNNVTVKSPGANKTPQSGS